MTYIDITPDPASSAARNTANTSTTWDSWAGTTESTLRSAASSSKDSVVTAAFEKYVGDVNPRMKSLARLAEKQGVDLGVSVQTAMDADHTGASEQQGPTSNLSQQTPMVNKPINAP